MKSERKIFVRGGMLPLCHL